MMSRPTEQHLQATARALYEEGVQHGWWPKSSPKRLEELDEIAREEFEALVERVLSPAGVSLKDLLGLEAQIKKAIAVAKERERQELKQEIEAIAQESGFTVGELFSGSGSKRSRVTPKYQNPDDPTETWTGRGRKPRWLAAKLAKGASMEDFALGRFKELSGPKSS